VKNITAGKIKNRILAAQRPRKNRKSAHLIESLRDKIRVTGDILSMGRPWHAHS